MPKPTHPKVIIREIPPKKVAVIKFSGFFNEVNLADKTAELKAWLAQKSLTSQSQPGSAGYNPPWTLLFLRRNEIHIERIE